MNLEISTYKDGTNSIVQNMSLYDKLIGLLMAQRLIEAYIFSYRSGGVQRAIQGIPELDKLYAEMNGLKAGEDIPYVPGINAKVKAELKRVTGSMQEKITLQIGIS